MHFVDDYWKGVAYGILDEAEQSGVEVVRVTSAGGYGNLQQQIAQLEALAALDLDALIIGCRHVRRSAAGRCRPSPRTA